MNYNKKLSYEVLCGSSRRESIVEAGKQSSNHLEEDLQMLIKFENLYSGGKGMQTRRATRIKSI